MTTAATAPSTGRMDPQPGDPQVSVSVLGEHTFCPRAGVLEFESNREDAGEEGQPVRVRFGLLYTIGAIKRELQRTASLLVAAAVAAVLVVTVGPSIHPLAFLLLGLLGPAILMLLLRILSLTFVYLRAIMAVAKTPDLDATEPQAVNWWQLLQSGFESHRPEEGCRDDRWRVVGRPWRLLVKGDLRIPVMRKLGTPKLYRQHFARIAGYCHLLERAERGARSPYGIVLFSPGYDGMTVPNYPGSRKAFHDALLSTRTTLKALSTNRRDPGRPTNTNLCRGCQHGRPRSGDGGSTYQSDCGARFGWTPPHARAFEKGLL